jgi:hypothetical protein
MQYVTRWNPFGSIAAEKIKDGHFETIDLY